MKGQGYIGVLIIILVIAAIFFLSGGNFQQFVQPTEAGGGVGVGVIIQNLDYKSTIKPEKTFKLTAEIANDGDFDAKNCIVNLSGFSSEWKIKEDDQESTFTISTKKINISKGDSEKVRWYLKAPTTELTYPFTVSVTYPYKTTFNALIKVVSESYAEEREEKGGIVSAKTSKGPLSVEISSDNDFILEGKIPVELTISNAGGGFIQNNKVTLGGLKNIECEKNVTDFEDITTREVTIDCDLTPGNVSTYKNLPVSINLTYTYQIEAEGMVEVTSE